MTDVIDPGYTSTSAGAPSSLIGNATGDPSTVDPAFAQDVGYALWSSGVDVYQLTPSQVDQLIMALWQDPFLQDAWQAQSDTGPQSDPIAGLYSNFSETYIKKELFDPTQTHSQFLVAQGIQMLQQSGKPLTSQQQTYGANLGGGDPAVLQAIAQAAQETGVPYNVALAVATAESGLDPNAPHGGLFQLERSQDTGQAGEGEGMTDAQIADPLTNARVALAQFKAVAAQDPTIVNDPGRWAAEAQRPKDPAGYAQRVNNLIQSGFGGSPSGVVPKPFDGNYPITEDHSEGDPGIDYGTPVGTSMYTPFAGTIRLEDSKKGNWGKRAMVVLDNGYTFAIGHLTQFAVADGQRVNPSDLLGLSGGDPSDPSSGITTGAHVEIQWISPGGTFLDPHTILDPILSGNATFRSLNLTGAEGSGVSATSARDRALGIDPILESKYPAAVSAFEKYMGRHPTATELMATIQHGMTPQELDDYFRSQPSQIPGISRGVFDDTKAGLDSVSQQLLGHPGTSGMVKELHDLGYTTNAEITFWLDQQGIAGKMDPKTYNDIWKANQGPMQAIYNENGFDPRIANAQYQQGVGHQAGTTPAPSPPQHPETIVQQQGANAPGFENA